MIDMTNMKQLTKDTGNHLSLAKTRRPITSNLIKAGSKKAASWIARRTMFLKDSPIRYTPKISSLLAIEIQEVTTTYAMRSKKKMTFNMIREFPIFRGSTTKLRRSLAMLIIFRKHSLLLLRIKLFWKVWHQTRTSFQRKKLIQGQRRKKLKKSCKRDKIKDRKAV